MDHVLFEYLLDPFITSAHPLSGPISGGTIVSVEGSGFSARAARLGYLLCAFNGTMVSPIFMSESLIKCMTPLSESGAVTLEVSNARPVFTSQGVIFEYTRSRLLSIMPAAGPTSGGTVVSLAGIDLVPANAAEPTCVFGSAYAASAHFISPSLVECTAPALPAGAAEIVLHYDGARLLVPTLFVAYVPAEIMAVSPLLGPNQGGTSVSIHGRHFEAPHPAFCNFGPMQVPAHVISETRLVCTSPASSAMGAVLLAIGDSVTSILYEYLQPVRLFDILPPQGPREGGTAVTVVGEGFSERAARLSLLICRFNETQVHAVYIGNSSLVCVSPQHLPGLVSVEVTNTRQQFSVSGLLFAYEAVRLLSVSPSSGPARGGSLLTVATDWLAPPARDGLYCHFGTNAPVPASYQSSRQLTCATPPLVLGVLPLQISVSGATFSSSLSFESQPEPRLDSLQPPLGPVAGGTRVTVFGTGFLGIPSIWCRFSGVDAALNVTGRAVLVSARRFSSTRLECVSPQLQAGYWQLELTLNGQAPFSKSSLLYESYAPIRLRAALPPRGSNTGEFAMHVYGDGFSARAARLGLLQCKFGERVSAATLVGSDAVMCLLPPGSSGFVTVAVSNNLVDFSTSNALFEYVPVRLTGITPRSGPEDGGTVVTVAGSGMYTAGRYSPQCLFGDGDARVSSQALLLSPSRAACAAPAAGMGVGIVNVRLLLHPVPTLESVQFSYLPAPLVLSARPQLGPAAGGSVVIVEGSGFVDSSWCRFGTTGMVPSRFISSEHVECVTQPHGPALVEVSVSPNGQDFQGGLQGGFEFLPAVVLHSITPSVGPVDGGSFVRIYGEHFPESAAELGLLRCRFNGTMVAAVLISARQLTCYAPRMPPGVIDVSVTTNLVDFVGGLFFEYQYSRLFVAEPPAGPIDGGTSLTIHGVGLAPGELHCRFWGGVLGAAYRLETLALFLSPSRASCVSPRWAAAAGPVSVALVNTEAVYGGAVTFEYVPRLAYLALVPRFGPVLGGTRLRVQGWGFVAGQDVRCRFGSIDVIATYRSSTRLACVAPAQPAAEPGENNFTLLQHALPVGGADPLRYRYTPHPHVLSAAPSRGMEGTVVFLATTKLDELDALGALAARARCRFNTTEVAGTLLSAERVRCVAPPALVDGVVAVELSPNMLDFSESGVTFTYQPSRATQLAPLRGPLDGGTLVRVSGERLMPSDDSLAGLAPALECTFASPDGGALFAGGAAFASVAASQQSTQRVLCASPPVLRSGSVGVTLSNGGATYGGQLQFVYAEAPRVSAAAPLLGPALGGTLVRGLGAHRSASAPGECRFSAANASSGWVALVSGEWRSTAEAVCVAPRPPAPLLAWLEVSQNGQNFSSDEVLFGYEPPLSPTLVTPAKVPAEGGALVRVHLGSAGALSSRAALLQLLRCRFDNGRHRVEVAASLARGDGAALRCASPRLAAGFAVLRVSSNGADYSAAELQLEFVHVKLRALAPLRGPARGGTRLLLTGGDFVPGAYSCLFGDVVAAATLESAEVLRCETPSAAAAGVAVVVPGDGETISVGLSLENVTLAAAHRFTYLAESTPHQLRPLLGPQDGGTRLRVLLAATVSNSPQLGCRFDLQSARATPVLVPAARRSATELECVTPAAPAPGGYIVEVTENGQQFSTGQLVFSYHAPTQLLGLAPTRGPVDGGTLVRVRGLDLLVAGVVRAADVACRFNATMVPAVRVLWALGAVECFAPSHMAGAVDVRLTNNLHDLSGTAPLLFEYVHVQLTSAAPSTGPVAGGTNVLIRGRNLQPGEVRCRFGRQGVTFATVDSLLAVRCVAPPALEPLSVELTLICANATCGNPIGFNYYAPAEPLELTPPLGPRRGGTLVRVLDRKELLSGVRRAKISHDDAALTELGWVSCAGKDGRVPVERSTASGNFAGCAVASVTTGTS